MGNSFKQWHKLVLVACGVLLRGGIGAPTNAQDPDYVYSSYGDIAAVNVFAAGTEWDAVRVGFWTSEDAVDYTLSVYDSFVPTGAYWPTGVTPLATVSSNRATQGYGTVNLAPATTANAGAYYVMLTLDNSEYAVDTGTGAGVSYYELTGYEAGVWYDLYDQGDYLDFVGGGAVPRESDLKFLMDIQTSWGDGNIWVEQTRGNWDVSPEAGTYVPPATLDAQITATDLGPFDIEIGVTGEMDTTTAPGLELIYINGTLENASGMDWSGLGVQLGYGLEGDFVLATDGLALTDGTNFFTEVFFDDLIQNGAIESELFPIVLPSGRDDPFFFTMRVYAIPEPGSLLLLGLASLALLAFGRPRR